MSGAVVGLGRLLDCTLMDHPVRRPRGRPLLYREGPTTTISCSVPVSLHDRLCRVAAHHGLTLSATTCKVLMLGLHHPYDAHPPDPSDPSR